VKNNCALFAPTPLFSGPDYPMASFKYLTCHPCCHGNEFWDKIDYNSAPLYAAARLYSVAMPRTDTSFHRT